MLQQLPTFQSSKLNKVSAEANANIESILHKEVYMIRDGFYLCHKKKKSTLWKSYHFLGYIRLLSLTSAPI